MQIDQIRDFMSELDAKKSTNFSGLGLIFYSEIDLLPIAPLKILAPQIKLPIGRKEDIIKFLLAISTLDSEYHDGFHLISQNFHLTHICQFFSTPIVAGVDIDYEHGSRHRSALYGSFLNSVFACAVCGANERSFIFKNGKTIKL